VSQPNRETEYVLEEYTGAATGRNVHPFKGRRLQILSIISNHRKVVGWALMEVAWQATTGSRESASAYDNANPIRYVTRHIRVSRGE
jgi:hypothetical protein